MCASHRPLRLCLVTPRYWLDRGFRCRPPPPRRARRPRDVLQLVDVPELRVLARVRRRRRRFARRAAAAVVIRTRARVSAAVSRRALTVRRGTFHRHERTLPRAAAGSTTVDLSSVAVSRPVVLSSTVSNALPSAIAPRTAAAAAHAMRMFSSVSRPSAAFAGASGRLRRALGLSWACAASASFFGGTAFCVAPSRWSGGWEMSSPNPRSAGTNGNEAREGRGARQRRRRKNARAGPSLPPKKNPLVVRAAPRGTRLGDGGGQVGRREGRANGGGGPSNSVSVRKVDGTSHSESMREERSPLRALGGEGVARVRLV